MKSIKYIPTKKELYYNYITLNKSGPECIEELKCTQWTFYQLLKKYEIVKSKDKINEQKQERMKETVKKEHGVDHPSQIPGVGKKISKKLKSRSEEDKRKSLEKQKESTRKSTGHDFALQSPECLQKLQKTSEEKYGTKYPNQSEVVKDKIKTKYKNRTEKDKRETREKNNNTWKNKSKNEIDNTTTQRKQTMINNYGVEVITQKNIKNFDIWNNDKKMIKWLHDNNKKYPHEIASFFNTTLTSVYRKAQKLEKIDSSLRDIFYKGSYFEKIIADWLNNNNIKFTERNRKIIKPYELDFVIEDKKIALEMNDTWSHSREFKVLNNMSNSDAKNYHNMKTERCEKEGYRLIHIFEKDLNDLDNVLSPLLKTKTIYARKLTYKHNYDIKNFILKNHKQHTSSVKYGGALLNENNEIIGAITFKKQKRKLYLDKLCFKLGYNVVGGSSKLFKNYLKNIDISEYDSIITFCDTTYHTGRVYEKLGFKRIITGNKMYYWVKGKEWNFRRNFQKSKLQKRFNLDPKYVKNHTEREIASSLGYVSIFMSNQDKYIYEL